jgi:hypothetical protein
VSPSAAAISVSETLYLLDTRHEALAVGVADGRYTFWLGSGISREIVPGLDGVVQKVIGHIQERIAAGDPDGRFEKALSEILDLAQLSEDERARLDRDQPVSDWVDRETIVWRLTQHYAELLDVRVAGEEADYLVWEAADVRATYPEALPPDVEHLCLAILGMEGVAANLVSANWDGLIEAGVDRLGGGPMLGVAVLQEDLRTPPRRSRLLKFHGCAVLAAAEPSLYRGALIGRQSQITDWPEAPASAAMRDTMKLLATTTRTLMIGLSTQDSNIQAVFSQAKAAMAWPWPGEMPAVAFAEDLLGSWQKNLLKVAYGDGYNGHGPQIEDEALVRAFGKSLLVALVLDVLARKARALIAATPESALGSLDMDILQGGISVLRDVAALRADDDAAAFVDDLLQVAGRFVTLSRKGTEPPDPATYYPLTMLPADQVSMDSNLTASGVCELAGALGLLGCGVQDGLWQLDSGATTAGTRGALRIDTGAHDRAVFFVANNTADVALLRRGVISTTTADAVVIHADDLPERPSRSTSVPPGRTGAVNGAHVSMRKLLRDSANIAELERAFRLGTGL